MFFCSAVGAQEVSAAVLAALGEDPIAIEVTGAGVEVAGTTLSPEAIVVLVATTVDRRPALLLVSRSGVPWDLDVALREGLVRTGVCRDVAFAGPADVPRRVDPAEVEARLAALGAADWPTREAASRELRGLGPGAVGLLRRFAPRIGDLEVRGRLERAADGLAAVAARPGWLGVRWRYEPPPWSSAGLPLLPGLPRPLLPDEAEEGEDRGPRGMRVEQVRDGSPAWGAGLAPGDVVEEIDGKALASRRGAALVAGVLEGLRSGRRVDLRVRRGGEELGLRALLGARPAGEREAD